MHKIQFWMGFRPPLGELTALPITLAELGEKGRERRKTGRGGRCREQRVGLQGKRKRERRKEKEGR